MELRSWDAWAAVLGVTVLAGCAEPRYSESSRPRLDERYARAPLDVATLAKYLERNLLWFGDRGLCWVSGDVPSTEDHAMGVSVELSDTELGRHFVGSTLNRWRSTMRCYSRSILSTAELYAWAERIASGDDYERVLTGVALTRTARLKIAWAMSLVTNTTSAAEAIQKVLIDNGLGDDVRDEVFLALQYQAVLLWCAELVSAKWIERECRWIELCFGRTCDVAAPFYPNAIAGDFQAWKEGRSEAAIKIVAAIRGVSGVRFFTVAEFAGLETSQFWNDNVFKPMATLSSAERDVIHECELWTRVAACRQDEVYPKVLTVGEVVKRLYSDNRKQPR